MTVSNRGADGVVIVDALQLLPAKPGSGPARGKAPDVEPRILEDLKSLEGSVADTSTHVLFYIDGRLHPTTRKSVPIRTDITSRTARPVKLGRNMGYQKSQGDKAHKVFRGDLDEVYIFDAALSGDQIQRLMESNRID